MCGEVLVLVLFEAGVRQGASGYRMIGEVGGQGTPQMLLKARGHDADAGVGLALALALTLSRRRESESDSKGGEREMMDDALWVGG